MNEYMTGTSSMNPVFSELTLSVLEDTGWYIANYSLAGQLLWGQGLGCGFTNNACNYWPSGYNGYFCTSNGAEACTSDYQALGVCQISSATGVPAIYQYFADPTQIGSYDLPDYCPYTSGYSNGWCFDPNADTTSIINNGQTFTPNSRCFSSSLAEDLPIGVTTSLACYETFCSGTLQHTQKQKTKNKKIEIIEQVLKHSESKLGVTGMCVLRDQISISRDMAGLCLAPQYAITHTLALYFFSPMDITKHFAVPNIKHSANRTNLWHHKWHIGRQCHWDFSWIRNCMALFHFNLAK
jgi:hypothetical protein